MSISVLLYCSAQSCWSKRVLCFALVWFALLIVSVFRVMLFVCRGLQALCASLSACGSLLTLFVDMAMSSDVINFLYAVLLMCRARILVASGVACRASRRGLLLPTRSAPVPPEGRARLTQRARLLRRGGGRKRLAGGRALPRHTWAASESAPGGLVLSISPGFWSDRGVSSHPSGPESERRWTCSLWARTVPAHCAACFASRMRSASAVRTAWRARVEKTKYEGGLGQEPRGRAQGPRSWPGARTASFARWARRAQISTPAPAAVALSGVTGAPSASDATCHAYWHALSAGVPLG